MRVKPDQPIDPGYVRKRLQVILKRAGCKSVRFHDLRHTFATMSLENGMDVKTLSTIIGDVSSATTLNTYTHITDEMRRKAAVSIDQGIAGVEVVTAGEEEKSICSEPEFTPVQPARRRPGTGYLKQIGENLWEGRYSPIWPDGKKHSRNVYGHTEAECEEKLAELILQMKAEIAALRSGASTEYPDGVSPKKKAIAAYLREYPGVTNKAKIARDLNMDRTTVQRYYDEIRAELMGEESLVPQRKRKNCHLRFCGTVTRRALLPKGGALQVVKQKSVCGISVVKREIAVVKTTAISILVDLIGFEPTTPTMRM